MTRHLTLTPDGWPCTYADCRPGLFVHDDNIVIKTDYDSAFMDNGDAWGGFPPQSVESRSATVVQPVVAKWVEVDDG